MSAQTESPLGVDSFIQTNRQNWDAQDSIRHLASIDSKLSAKSSTEYIPPWRNEAPLGREGVNQVVYQSVPVSTPPSGFTSGEVLIGSGVLLIIYFMNKRG